MARLTPLSPETTPELQPHFDFFLGTLGFTPNSVLTMQRKPKLAQALAVMNAAVMDPAGEVDQLAPVGVHQPRAVGRRGRGVPGELADAARDDGVPPDDATGAVRARAASPRRPGDDARAGIALVVRVIDGPAGRVLARYYFDAEALSESLFGDSSGDGQRSLQIQKADFTVNSIIDKINRGKVNLRPSYQREYVWTVKTASKLVESLMLNIPIPTMFFHEVNSGCLEVVDGKQRLTSIWSFTKGALPDGTPFKLKGLDVFNECQRTLHGRKLFS